MDKGAQSLLNHDLITQVASKYKKSQSTDLLSHSPITQLLLISLAAAQVLLRWATQRGIAVIPKTNDAARLRENLQCDSFELAEDEIKRITALNIDLRVSLSLYCSI